MKNNRVIRPILLFPMLLITIIFPLGCKKDPVVPPPADVKPTLITSAISGITPYSAISGGIISDKGSSDVTAKGVCWGTSPNPDISGSHTNEGSGTTIYTSNLTGLSPDTTYYVRAYATNSSGTGYGAAVSFKTPADLFTCGDQVTYEGKTYQTVMINTQCWFKQNLNVGTRINGNQNQTNNSLIEKHCYNDEESNCDFYGGLYQWDEMMQYIKTQGAQGICPPGWHLPTDIDWSVLTIDLGGDDIAGGMLKQAGFDNWAAPNTGATNSSGFTALGAGSHSNVGFDNLMLYSFLWSSSQDTINNEYAVSRVLDYSTQDVFNGPGARTNSFSVRCVHN